MIWAEIDWDVCLGCHPCLAQRACSMHAIVKIAPDEPAFIELDRCHGCGKCVPACRHAAIHLVRVSQLADKSQIQPGEAP